ncbi:phage tail protein [Pseudomonas sp. MN1F]|uniref:phage tail protein n=1 Tax=Pseudomonas sp. MN1F TaxID=1366632 RepID=UPI00128F1C0E|nr:tail fiber protein [Pseudomonas sp. MN1F]MQG95526.1 phage tail protein [Pseudomonas sp. MN1F]
MSDPFLGEIKMFGGNFAPRGYAFCSGQQMAISQNAALFAILGTTFGGNGVSTFGLPDFQGRSPVHWGQGPGLSLVDLGEASGVETVTLLTSNMPAHLHSLQVSSADATSNKPIANGYLGAAVDKDLNPVNLYTATAPAAVNLNTSISGSSLPVENRSPYLAVSFIIALMGEFPSHN